MMRYLKWSILPVLVVLLAMPLESQQTGNPLDRTQARSMVITRRGIVATSQTLASQAGAQILARGGSAADAAIAANAVMGVVEPMSNGMGGDLFAIVREDKTNRLSGLNASGWAPQKLTIDYLKQKGFNEMPQLGIHSVTVPGCVRGWAELHKKFGRLPWAELFKPAIFYARNGFPVTEFISAYWHAGQSKLEKDPNARQVFLPGGKAPEVGQIFSNPGYANALEVVAREGADAFYRGEIAKAILKTSDRLGGTMSAADLADYQAEWVEPISTNYHGWTVYELPPNGQGMAALEMLNIMERFPLSQLGFASPEAWHVKMEAQKLAYGDLRRYNGDPRFVKVPDQTLISKAWAEERAKTIDLKRAHCDVEPGDVSRFKGDTIYLTVVDRDGNIVSLIQSLYEGFGSGVVVDDFGITLQDRGGLFLLDPSHPDALAPHKRPFHTIIPAYMEKGSVHVGFGIMGGLNQPQAHAQFVSDVVDFGMNIQSALEAPRFTNPNFGGCTFLIEDRVPEPVRQALTSMGHQLVVRGA
ncbi:MAG TPA: gamma-glutamyltransferase, partial [Terriglobia bacterium]|nr:gamma-glutamyltransferase [Terriglobia bacterium]